VKKSRRTKIPALNATAARRSEALHLMNTYKRPAQVFTYGRGCYVYDQSGRAYLDFLGGIAVNALGHAHPRLVRVIRREAGRAIHHSNLFHNAFQGPLAAKLARWSGLDRVFFTNSGGEAIEGALKLARLVARKHSAGAAQPPTKLLALENSFHGRTAGALSLTATLKYREPFAPLLPGIEFIPLNDVSALEAKFDASVCALFIETIQGEGGIHPVSEEFYLRARELATRHGAALVADEIQCGLGRTGRAFAFQKFAPTRDLAPDIVTIAKPLAGGLPLGAFIAREEFASAISPGLHGTTFGGGPLVCATALEFLSTVEEEKLMDNVRARGAEVRAGLDALKAKFDFIREVRGEGLMLGVELDLDGAPYIEQALSRGLIINCAHERTLRFLPPFIITRRHVEEFLDKLETVLRFTARPKSQPRPAETSTPHVARPAALAAAR